MHLTADRKGNIVEKGASLQDRILAGLYGSLAGRALLRLLTVPAVSRAGGALLDSRISRGLIPWFIRSHSIDMSQYRQQKYGSYNAFFVRRLEKGARRLDPSPWVLASPCDSRVSVYRIDGQCEFSIKGTWYTVQSLLRDPKLAAGYAGGYVWVFRLCVDDYHRYVYVDGGKVSAPVRIPGVLHTVNPVANERIPIYKENAREYCILRSEHFGDLLQMEVGALFVGRIRNHMRGGSVRRGWEKGRFEFGGSTVILITKQGMAEPDGDILKNSKRGLETRVKLGERVGGRQREHSQE